MEHLNEGALRRLYDDPLGLADAQRTHFAHCETCRERFDAVLADARRAAELLAVTPAGVHPEAALAAVRSRPPVALARRFGLPRGRWRPALALGLAAALAVTLAVTGAAEQLLTIAQPTQVAVVPVTSSELQALPDLSHFGTMSWSGQPNLSSGPATAAQAQTEAGFAAPQVGSLPSGIPAQPAYSAMGASTVTFTFSAAKAQAWAASQNETLPAMPTGLDGSTLTLNVGPAIAVVYGGESGDGQAGVPQLVIGKMKAPSLESTGPSVQEIESYLLSVPGVSPQLAAQIRALGDPTQTLPLPIPVDRTSTQDVTVDNVHGVLIGDNTGLGAGVIWVKDGYVYGVAGTLGQDQVLAVAQSLS